MVLTTSSSVQHSPAKRPVAVDRHAALVWGVPPSVPVCFAFPSRVYQAETISGDPSQRQALSTRIGACYGATSLLAMLLLGFYHAPGIRILLKFH